MVLHIFFLGILICPGFLILKIALDVSQMHHPEFDEFQQCYYKSFLEIKYKAGAPVKALKITDSWVDSWTSKNTISWVGHGASWWLSKWKWVTRQPGKKNVFARHHKSSTWSIVLWRRVAEKQAVPKRTPYQEGLRVTAHQERMRHADCRDILQEERSSSQRKNSNSLCGNAFFGHFSQVHLGDYVLFHKGAQQDWRTETKTEMKF